MGKRAGFAGMLVVVAIALAVVVALPGPAAAIEIDSCIPVGTEIVSATLSVYIGVPGYETVQVHRVTAPWEELTVTWNSFAGSFDPTVEGTFLADSGGWRSVDVTALVQAWVDGTYSNHGFYLQQSINRTEYRSSEYGVVAVRPMLEICYADGGGTTCVTIQRTGALQGPVMDTYINEALPDLNRGAADTLHTGLLDRYQKQALIWFDICEECNVALTPGYWKNHIEAWPVYELELGCETYDAEEIMLLLWASPRHDASVKLAQHLIAAKFNLLSGTDPSAIADTITTADGLLCGFEDKLPYRVRQRTSIGHAMLQAAYELDLYNNNFLTPECEEPQD